jgi:ketosteroid isomerase-like protein
MFCSAACTQAPPAPDLKALEAKSAESAAKDVADIKALEDRFTNAVLSRDVNAIMTFYVPDASLFVFDVTAAPVRGRGSLSEGLG